MASGTTTTICEPPKAYTSAAAQDPNSIELQPQSASRPPSERRLGDASSSAEAALEGGEGNGITDPPMMEEQGMTTAKERWNHPKQNQWRVYASFFSFVMCGMNDAVVGALIPYIEPFYDLTYTVVSLLFLAPFVGYILAAATNNTFHMRLGRRGVAFVAPICHIAAWLTLALHPPFPVLVCLAAVAGFGTGLIDAGWNAWLGNMANANELLGFLHGCYGLGATISPLIATTLVNKAGWQWYSFYFIMLGGAVIELVTSLSAFWTETGAKFRHDHQRPTNQKGGRTREALTNKTTWTIAVFLLCYVGIEVSLGGWIVEFMIQIRKENPFASGISVVGFWLGVTVGRVILGFVTPKIGEKLAITIYLGLSVGLELLFWLVPRFIVSAIAVGFLGFFLGPLFPGAVIAATKLLPTHLHVPAIGFAAAFGGTGAAALPFAVGALAQAKGVQVLQPIILALLVVSLGLWALLPRIKKAKREEDGEVPIESGGNGEDEVR